MGASNFFTKDEKAKIVQAIAAAEMDCSGEIRVHIDTHCDGDVLDRAAYVFEKLKMHKTSLRNGVLFYLAVDDHKLAVIGDAGINKLVPEGFWDCEKEVMLEHFKKSEFVEGLVKGISLAGQKLKEFFPRQHNDANELSDEISFSSKLDSDKA